MFYTIHSRKKGCRSGMTFNSSTASKITETQKMLEMHCFPITAYSSLLLCWILLLENLNGESNSREEQISNSLLVLLSKWMIFTYKQNIWSIGFGYSIYLQLFQAKVLMKRLWTEKEQKLGWEWWYTIVFKVWTTYIFPRIIWAAKDCF